MINRINEKIYNYIFSINAELRNNKEQDVKEFEEKLDSIIAEKYDVIADFWEENAMDFNNNCVKKIQYIDMPNPEYIYISFPRMRASIKESFLNYKAEQIANSIEENGDFLEENCKNLFEEIDNLGIKEILDYCKENNIIKYTSNPFMSADDNPAYEIFYDNIKANYNLTKTTENNVLKSSFLLKYFKIEKYKDSANAEIWLVKDEEDREYIAKVLNKNISTEKLKRYRNEINFCKCNRNPHLIEIIDNGITNINNEDYMFYIMPKYNSDFRELMSIGINEEQILFYYNQILEGIKYIHNKKSFHRDIKPENVLYDKETNLLVICDLGIAHFNEEELISDPKTKKTSKMANFMYSAPEQRIKGGKVDYRCDIYALGLILNELFTGQIIQGSNYKRISEVSEKFAFLDPIVEKMTNQDSDKRYNSIEEIQYEINVGIEINNIKENVKVLKKIEIEQDKEKDILIDNPIKIVGVKLDNNYKLTIRFNNPVNDLWIETLKYVDKTELHGYGPESFDFGRDTASISLNEYSVNNVPKIVEYFKTWIEDTNKIYPKKAEENLKEKLRLKEENVKREIEEKEKLQEIIKKIRL